MVNSAAGMGGLFITFEGTEGCGKTTQVALLADELREAGHTVVCLREPGGTLLGNVIRGLLLGKEAPSFSHLTEAYLFATSRAELVQRIIRPALDADKVVICDRFVDSSLVYQGMARGLGVERILGINRAAVDGCWPTLSILLDLPTEDGLARVRSRSLFDRIEEEEHAFHDEVRQGFLDRAADNPERFMVVDARGSRMDVHRAIMSEFRRRFPEHRP